eukprot:scaffold173037_cov30-Tisochrysis_lutea.AAC.4
MSLMKGPTPSKAKASEAKRAQSVPMKMKSIKIGRAESWRVRMRTCGQLMDIENRRGLALRLCVKGLLGLWRRMQKGIVMRGWTPGCWVNEAGAGWNC